MESTLNQETLLVEDFSDQQLLSSTTTTPTATDTTTTTPEETVPIDIKEQPFDTILIPPGGFPTAPAGNPGDEEVATPTAKPLVSPGRPTTATPEGSLDVTRKASPESSSMVPLDVTRKASPESSSMVPLAVLAGMAFLVVLILAAISRPKGG